MEALQVLYDQDCGICTASARLLARLDRGRGRIALVPFVDARRRGIASELDDERFYASFHAIEHGRTLSGADAVPPLLDRLPFGRLPARLLRSSPTLMRATAAAYGFVARNRHRISRACGLPHSPIPPKTKSPPSEKTGR